MVATADQTPIMLAPTAAVIRASSLPASRYMSSTEVAKNIG